ncbi:MAG: dual specificity protein phosphatase family protein [Anaerolineae bacterium]|nr:dual specificity protein phosphatase family protein [Anaerolineae bacterium]MBN8618836.1 dual specificity protein phosphatase family protein [Anaerolineae bacterium]
MTLIPPRDEDHLERKSPILDILKQLSSLLYGLASRGPLDALRGLVDFLARLIRGAPLPRYSRITPNVYVSGQHRRRGMSILRGWGITGSVNLRSEYDDDAAGIAAANHLHLATIDNTAPTLEQIERGVAFMRDEIARGGKVYVHCAAGVGRAPTMAAAYLVSEGLTTDEAWATIRQVRPFIRPTSEQQALVRRYAAGLSGE